MSVKNRKCLHKSDKVIIAGQFPPFIVDLQQPGVLRINGLRLNRLRCQKILQVGHLEGAQRIGPDERTDRSVALETILRSLNRLISVLYRIGALGFGALQEERNRLVHTRH